MVSLAHSNTATRAELLAELRREVAEAGTPRAWATKHNVTPALVAMTLAGDRDMSDTIATALGFMRPAFFIRIRPVA